MTQKSIENNPEQHIRDEIRRKKPLTAKDKLVAFITGTTLFNSIYSKYLEKKYK